MNLHQPEPEQPREIGPVDDDPGCARCGSSTGWLDCWACSSGLAYDEDEDTGDTILVACEWCRGNGGENVCLSPAEWCQANPLPGREEVERS